MSGSNPQEVDWFWNRLDVSGPQEDLQSFIHAAQGPGFVPWDWGETGDLEYTAALIRRGGAPNLAAAEKLAHRYREKLWFAIEDARSAAERGLSIVPLDLNALIPIPSEILRTGHRRAGAEWCRQNWGTAWPLRKVSFAFAYRRTGAKIEPVGQYEFIAGDWSPWAALVAIQEQWMGLKFRLSYELDEAFVN